MHTLRPVAFAGRAGSRPATVGAGVAALLAGLTACAGGDGGERSASPTPQTSSSSRPGESPSSEERTGVKSGESSAPSSPTEAPPPTGTVVRTGGSVYGTMLFDRSGQAIYLFEKETGPRAACYGACAEAWPPVLTDGRPRASGEARQRLLGTTERRDGSRQVTYAGHPLYFYAHEDQGEVLCHDVDQFGALWLVVRPNGRPAPH